MSLLVLRMAFDLVALGLAIAMVVRAREHLTRSAFTSALAAAPVIVLGNLAIWHWAVDDGDLAMASGVLAIALVTGLRVDRFAVKSLRSDQTDGDLSKRPWRGILALTFGFALYLTVQALLT